MGAIERSQVNYDRLKGMYERLLRAIERLPRFDRAVRYEL